jgi:hypothetical protein
LRISKGRKLITAVARNQEKNKFLRRKVSSNNDTEDMMDSGSSDVSSKDNESIDLQALQKQFESGVEPNQDSNETFSLQTSMSSKTWVKKSTKKAKISGELLAS